MTYVPDYVRPVIPKSLPTTPIGHGHTRRTASFAGHLTQSVPRERSSSTNMKITEETPNYNKSRRRSSSNPATNPLRYMRPSQDRVCGRLSIKERLKSLESEAAVKLEVRHTAPRPKRRSTSRPMRASAGSEIQSEDSLPSSQSGSRKTSVSTKSDIFDSDLKNNIPEATDEDAIPMPKPDIIESHQPKDGSQERVSDNKINKPTEVINEIKQISNESKHERQTNGNYHESRSETNSLTTKLDIVPNIDNSRLKSGTQNSVKVESSVPKVCGEKPTNRVSRRKKGTISEKNQTEEKAQIFETEEAKIEITSDSNNIAGKLNRSNIDKANDLTPKPKTMKNIEDTMQRTENSAEKSYKSDKLHHSNLDLPKSTQYCSSNENIDQTTQPALPKHASSDGNTSADSSDATKINKVPKIKDRLKENDLNTIPGKVKGPGSGLRLVWRTPSIKQAQKPIDKDIAANGDKKDISEKAVFSQGDNSNIIQAPLAVSEVKDNLPDITTGTTTITPPTSIGSAFPKQQEQSIIDVLTSDAANVTTSYPVELRSPRNEQANRRQGARDKRNARVFIVPSSSDSDMDNNPIARMDRDFAKLGLTRAVDLLPKSTNNNAVNSNSASNINEGQQTIKHVAPVKFVPYVLKSNYTDNKTEEKKDTSMDSSSQIYPELTVRTAKKESNQHSKPHDNERRKDSQKSPGRRRKSTRSGRSGGNRSKSTDTRKIYNEQQRHRSNSMCEAKRDRQRQGSVAQAVIFGNAPDSTIPYIDDTTSPSEEKAPDGSRSHPRRMSMSDGTKQQQMEIAPIHRSNSADVLSSTNAAKSPPKMRRTRALSADRTNAKGVHRRSYQIATMAMDVESDPKHQRNLQKFKSFLQDSDLDESLNADRSIDSSIDDPQRTTRSGYLHFKVATIDKGKRTSSQKSWKLVWVALKDHHLHLSKDLSKSKNNQEATISRQISMQEDVQPLNIQSSLVEIAYNYVKRRNVFKISTFNGSEYLFQAENRDDMLAWISAIQSESVSWEDGSEAINEDLILRKTNQIQKTNQADLGPKSDKKVSRKRSPKPNLKNNLQVKDVDGSRRFKWRGSVNRIVKKFGTGQPFLSNGTFGVHLEDCPPSQANDLVPSVVDLCCSIVNEHGLHFTGIYRVPGNSAVLTALQEDLNNQGVDSLRPDDERLRDLNVVSSLLKSFFRKLPEPLFTNELYHNFVQANRRPVSEDRLNSLRRLIHMLPGPHYETLKFLITHLRLIADNSDKNKMEVRNLAIVFGPTLVRNTSSDNTATMVTDMSDQCRIIESIIEHAEWFFSDTFDPAIEETHVASIPVPVEKEREAVPNIEFLLENVGRKPGDTGNNTSESTKSKASDDSEKDSFSRDIMEMFFGKRWMARNSQPTTIEDHGGFEDYEFRKQQEAASKKEENSTKTEPPKSPNINQVSSISNVGERLMEFYNEHLERLSQTTIGLTFPAFSSADSSPRTTPRHSTILNAPLVFPTPSRNFGSRNRLNSDDGRYVTSSTNMTSSANQINKTPPFPLPEALGRTKGVPQYIHPPNPYGGNKVVNSTPKQTINSQSTTTFSDSSALQSSAMTTVSNSNRNTNQSNSLPTVKMRKHSSTRQPNTENASQIRKNTKENYQPNTSGFDITTELPFTNERLVGELPKPVQRRISSPTSSTGSKSPKQPIMLKNESAGEFKRKTSSSSVHVLDDNIQKQQSKETVPKTTSENVANTQRKRRKSPLKENVAVTKTLPERTFSRYDPKRRGIRFAGNENEPSFSGNAPGSPGKLTATERLFNEKPIRRKPSTREKKKSSVIRRHTLSGLQDLEQHSPLLANNVFKSNLKQVAMGQNLSMYDLLTISGQGQSAMERLNPRGASSGLTLSNWIVQERLRNKTEQRNGCTLTTKKESKSKDPMRFHSYV